LQDHLLTRTCPEFKAQKTQQSTKDTYKAGRRATTDIVVEIMPPLIAKGELHNNTTTEVGQQAMGALPLKTRTSNSHNNQMRYVRRGAMHNPGWETKNLSHSSMRMLQVYAGGQISA